MPSDRNEGRRHLEDAEYRLIKNYEGWSESMEEAIRTIVREEIVTLWPLPAERARVADMEGDAPEPAPADEPEGLEVVAFQKFDGGHLYYAAGYTSDPRAEHLVKKSDAMALLAEKDAEWLMRTATAEKALKDARARITELEAQEVTAGMIEAASRSYMTDAPGDADYWEWQADRINAALRSDSEEATNDR